MILHPEGWSAMRPRLEALFQASFGRTIQAGYLDWRYRDNGRDRLLFNLELDGVEPVASYSACPVELVQDGRCFATALSMTTMTHPRWRGRGLFQKLAAELYRTLGGPDLGGVWGFPNAVSHPLFTAKLQWNDIHEVPALTLGLDGLDPARLPPGLEAGSDDAFLLAYPEPPRDGLIRVHRTREYLAWRYARNPVNVYRNYVLARHGQVSSYVVAKAYEDGLDLVDIQAAAPEEALGLLSWVVRTALDQGAKRIQCWAPLRHWVHRVLEQLGFRIGGPVTYFGGVELAPRGMPEGWREDSSWYYQMSDSDVF